MKKAITKNKKPIYYKDKRYQPVRRIDKIYIWGLLLVIIIILSISYFAFTFLYGQIIESEKINPLSLEKHKIEFNLTKYKEVIAELDKLKYYSE